MSEWEDRKSGEGREGQRRKEGGRHMKKLCALYQVISMTMCVRLFVGVHVYLVVCICVFVSERVYMLAVCVCVHMCVCVCVCVCVLVYMCARV